MGQSHRARPGNCFHGEWRISAECLFCPGSWQSPGSWLY